ncbi:MAG TPA: thiamine pyrophosphate-binding protein, partial [Afipia sp.]
MNYTKSAELKTTTGGRAIVESFLRHGVERIYCVPGESFLGIIDALVDAPGIELIATRHESGAGFMAVADARLSGRPGVVMVSRGPGASNVTIAIQNAMEDGVPLVIIVGQVDRQDLGRGAFQEVNYAKTYSDLAKWTVQIDNPAQAMELMAKAFHVAQRGLPGPVVVVVPEDMLDETCANAGAPIFSVARPNTSLKDVEKAAGLLAASKRPLLIAGMALNTQRGRKALLDVANAWDIPIAASARQPDIIDNMHQSFTAHLGYATDPKLVNGLRESDAILAVGTRLGDVTSQAYTFPAAPFPSVPLIHVHESVEAIGTVRETELAILADCAEFLEILVTLAPTSRPWAAWRDKLHATYVQWSQWLWVEADDGVVFGAIVDACSRHLPQDTIVTADAGNFGGWLNRYFRYRTDQKFLNALSGAMGYGVPAAVAASIRYPDRPVVCFVGDGGFL